MKGIWYLIKYLFVICVFISVFVKSSPSQTFSKYGLKAGFLTSGLSTYNQFPPFTLNKPNLYIEDESDYFTYLNLDAAIFAEWFNSEEFCVSTELHYSIKGEKDKIPYLLPNAKFNNTTGSYETGFLNDKAGYLSLQILPRYRAGISDDGMDDLYLFAGPTFNFMVNDMSSYSDPKYIERKGFLGDIGAAFGIGFELEKIYTFELKLDYSITGSYSLKYGNDKVTRRYNAFWVLGGVALSELFKK